MDIETARKVIEDKGKCSAFNCCPYFCSTYTLKTTLTYAGKPVSCNELLERAKEVVANETT